MSMFTLAISCLITSNLPWFMELTFQVPIQYCSLLNQTYFYHQSHPQLGFVFTLAQPLHSFWIYFSTLLQVVYWAPTDLGSSSFSVIFCLFLLFIYKCICIYVYMEASWWRDWLWRNQGLVLMGRAMLSKPLIQFSVNGLSCVPSLLLGLRPNYGEVNDGNGDLLQKDLCRHCCILCP